MPFTISAPALSPIAATLCAVLEQGTLPHALLLEGGTPAQRREAALALGQILLCKAGATGLEAGADDSGITEEMFGGFSLFGDAAATPQATAGALPCGRCSHCIKCAAGAHPDLRLLEDGHGSKSIPVDAVRDLRTDAFVLPNEAVRKVFLLHNAHTLTREAQNALLKLLEEPPGYLCLVLTAPAARLLLPTVISRVTLLPLGEAKDEAPDPAREAQVQALAKQIAEALLGGDAYAALAATAPLEGERDLTRDTLPALRRALHEKLKDCAANGAAPERILALMENAENQAAALERNGNLNLLLTRLAVPA
ncbi:MAG: hypothetical protein LBS96_00420 [Oscillospiraceae bacterium]|jgi:DNA polymerase III delta prime subunit|nr:hypothetical protein [Oscillospiraceae bacterium]